MAQKKTVMFLLILISAYLSVCFVNCESDCSKFETCGGCIGYAYDICVWCPALKDDNQRCQSLKYSNEHEGWCNDTIYNPESQIIIEQDDDFSAGEGSKFVQFTPQKIKIKARPGVTVNITMSYKPATHYPLDVYYLMDYTATMKNHYETLRQQGNTIYNELKNMTNNVRLGIGTFVEKPALPFADPEIQTAYAFKHHISLATNNSSFEEFLEIIPTGANYDDPEAGLDAIMQAMVCKDDIGWRDKARRIIVMFSDSTYHSAGDGKFAGAFRPNDMTCHLKNNIYSESLTYDYPSVSQINEVASKNNFKIIFAVTGKSTSDYKRLIKRIQGSIFVKLEEDIVGMITSEYLKLVMSVNIHSNVLPFVQVSFDPDCSKNDQCQFTHKQAVNVTAFIKIKSCPTTNERKLNIGPVALNEKLEVDIEVDCECDCEKDVKNEKKSPACSEAGTLQCGICICDENRFGNTCQCEGVSSDIRYMDKCKANENDTSFCSGHGICRCGKCEDCEPGFSGDFCQFDAYSCPSPGGIICSGNGDCNFGRCDCKPQWIGDDCRCPDNEQSCIAPISTQICSGKGECVCGQCICMNTNDSKKSCYGRFCDDCDDMVQKRCKELEKYAYCNYVNNKTECDKTYNQTETGVALVNKTDVDAVGRLHNVKWCKMLLDEEKSLRFMYYYPKSTEQSLEIVVQKELELPVKVDIWVAVGSAIGTVLLIGLLTFVARKIICDIYDAREYKKFEEDLAAENIAMGVNPHYNSPHSNFSNPAYKRQSVLR